MSQWNTLYSYPKQSLFFKRGNREVKHFLPGCWYQWEGGDIRKGWRRVNVVEILHTHIWNWKNETCWNCSRNGVGGIKKNDDGVNLTMIYCKNFGKCHNYPQYNNNKIKKKKKTLGSGVTLSLCLTREYCLKVEIVSAICHHYRDKYPKGRAPQGQGRGVSFTRSRGLTKVVV
jgi:hypothetical protein